MAETAIPTMDVWVADLDGVVVGQMMLAPGWLHHLVSRSGMDPTRTGRRVHDVARRASAGPMELWAFQSNHRGRRFYERHGFVAVEFTDGAANEEQWPDVRYVRHV
jgi:hypothetical protein